MSFASPTPPASPLSSLADPSPTVPGSGAAEASATGASAPAQQPARFRPPATVPVWGLPFSQLTLDGSLDAIDAMIRDGQPRYVITANLNYVMLSHGAEEMAAINRDAALILADGQPIVWRSQLHAERLPERVAGSEMIYRLAERSAQRGWRIFFLGAAPGVAQRCAKRLSQLYPGCQIAGVESPPFRALSSEEEAGLHQRIRDAAPDILLVAFGQPKGERWIHRHYRQLGVPVSIQLGASFDFVAGAARRAPRLIQRTGMEWAYRMAHDPRRLLPRYAGNAAFLGRTLMRELVGRG